MMDVLVAGAIYADLILSGFDEWPHPGQESFAREFRREIGGGAAITACGLASLGVKTGILGVVGGDSEWMVGRLHQKGVDTSALVIDRAADTGLTVAVSNAEDRAFFTYRGANRRLFEFLQDARPARRLPLACLPPWDLDVARIAGGATVSLDVGWHPPWLRDPRALDLLRKIDIFFPNRPEASLITGECRPEEILRYFQRAGIQRVALKLGAEGAALLWDGEIYFAGPHPVSPVDTTGAGDCFDAGFLYAWLRGESPEKCLRTANVCGALSTEARGGIEGFPALERIV